MVRDVRVGERFRFATVESQQRVVPGEPFVRGSVPDDAAHDNRPFGMCFDLANNASQVVVSRNEIVVKKSDDVEPTQRVLKRGVALRGKPALAEDRSHRKTVCFLRATNARSRVRKR